MPLPLILAVCVLCVQEACSDPEVCGFVAEPIQGENGVVVPSDGYLRGVRDICSRHNVRAHTHQTHSLTHTLTGALRGGRDTDRSGENWKVSHVHILSCDLTLCVTNTMLRMLGVDHEGVRPDVVILGKALSGGILPVRLKLLSLSLSLSLIA